MLADHKQPYSKSFKLEVLSCKIILMYSCSGLERPVCAKYEAALSICESYGSFLFVCLFLFSNDRQVKKILVLAIFWTPSFQKGKLSVTPK